MRLALAVVALLLLLPATAGAATVRVEQVSSCGNNPVCEKYSAGGPVPIVVFAAVAGEVNSATVRRDGAELVLRDDGPALVAGEGCTAVDDGTVRCPVGTRPAEAESFHVRLGDGDDRLVLEGDLGDFALLDGGAGADVIRGGGESDRILAGAGADAYDGGGGVDTLTYSRARTGVHVDLKRGTARHDGEQDALAGIETVLGTRKDDVLIGSADGDVLLGSDGSDRLSGRGGDDHLDGGLETDRLSGGSGEDRLVGDPTNEFDEGDYAFRGDDVLDGGSGADLLKDEVGGRDRFHGGAGDDTVLPGYGSDPVRSSGGRGDDVLVGASGSNWSRGGPGDDQLGGGEHGDRLLGGPGADRLDGLRGRDRLDGGTGDDRLAARDGRRDRVDGGGGRDVVQADARDRVERCERRSDRRPFGRS